MDWIKAIKEGMGLILNLMEPKIKAHIERIIAGVVQLVERFNAGWRGEVQILRPIFLLTFYKFYIIIYV